MADAEKTSGSGAGKSKTPAKLTREERLAAELRANLKRRKSAAKARQQAAPPKKAGNSED